MSTIEPKIVTEWALAGAGAIGGASLVTAGIGYGLTATTGVGAGVMPLVAGVFVGASGLLWLLRLARARHQRVAVPQDEVSDSTLGVFLQGEDDELDDARFPDRVGWTRIAVVVGSIAVAALLLPVLGYSVTMVALLTVVLRFVGGRKLWLAVLVAIATTAASRLVFEVWLHTALPHSTLAPLAWLGL
ncbi:tripartite tricarboxylate transporter TctB family protein [Microbacteriaceae bacterium VKM Ac-2854]|nr:tripartite tricarboxylate transporter TctB family protein [Microbacteriaceae bacterium VKM Ac-2854]